MSFTVRLTNLDYENTRGSDRHSTCKGMPDGMTAMIDRETEHEFLGIRLVQEHTGGGIEYSQGDIKNEKGHLVEGDRRVGHSPSQPG